MMQSGFQLFSSARGKLATSYQYCIIFMPVSYRDIITGWLRRRIANCRETGAAVNAILANIWHFGLAKWA